ncbi:hypothetical protein HCH_00868 [Hahella chejuensis KCTC 2396]|uniref:Uncharacterized protein n=1 Tax=Hahella chejuensis (strain KCTC 2396) TaxID=349521 RepID=Q2SNL4_HAHCH|nr:hypothetical protein HCH_00868 [Hahella chejuensis KCTC 2396]
MKIPVTVVMFGWRSLLDVAIFLFYMEILFL